ncbi:phosphomannomutase/phosphoglucomutase [bacterium BMS3Abin15]|nr:phosphomannomutase/phosphoglucomutase [bacterium BMS3Abin15]HDZ85538.1 phosphomannomutase/phosphoglucomutase [Candidatus Moranbacteria bacterium]
MNPEIFKAYDIRGVYNKDFDDELAYKLGLAYSTMRRGELDNKEDIQIVVGMDMRVSSSALKEKLIKGLTDGGVNVIDIGLSSTPTFYFAVAHFKYDGGIIVSASHNPKEYNGFKLVRDKALSIGKETGIFNLRAMVVEDKLKKADKKGTVVKREDVLEEQIKYDLNYADIKNIEPFKIVIDTANAMGSLYFDALFKHLPCEVVKMNWKLDGTFPSHEADPLKPENMEDLGKKVLEEKADLGIATDGDGDRIFFTDNEGKIVEPGIARAILCKLFLLENPGAKIAYDIRPGRITPDTITENGGTPIVTRVGHSLIKTQAIKEGAVFAGESSGHFFLNMDEGCYEIPLIVTLKILEELSRSNQSFSNYIKPYKKYFNSGEINSEVSDPLAKITEIKNRYADAKQNELDGITIEYPDYWFNVRPSNTEPLLRLNLEAVSQEIMEEKRDELLKLIRG